MAERTCDVDGCDAPHEARGFCQRHYLKYRRYGDPLAGFAKNPRRLPCSVDGCAAVSTAKGLCQRHYDTQRRYSREQLLTFDDRFWMKVDRRDSNDCWEWQGARSPIGYGHVAYQGVVTNAHRVSFMLAYGYMPPVVRHACDNPPCVNPQHLLPGTHRLNSGDMVRRGRSTRGERNGYARLNADQVREIRRRVAGGETQRAVARAFGISFQTVSVIVLRKVWRHVS